MRKVKVLHLITRIDNGGSAQNTLLTVRGLRDKYEITLVTGSVKDVDVSDINPVIIPELRREINLLLDVICLFKLYKFISKNKFDIVHTHSSKGGFLGRLSAKLAGAKLIVHTPHGHIFYGYFNFFLTSVFILLERVAAKFTDKIISLTPDETKDYISLKIARSTNKFATIHSGVDVEKFMNVNVDKFKKRSGLGIPPTSPVIICSARLVPVKGHMYLIDAYKKVVNDFPSAKLLLVGDGPLLCKLKNQSKSISNKVLFLGDRVDLTELLSISDIFVLGSLNEGMGRAIIEAMAAGLPVVATGVGGIPSVVIDGVTGILVPPKRSDRLAFAIIKLLCDSELRKKLGSRGKELSVEYSVGAMLSKIDALYKNLVDSK